MIKPYAKIADEPTAHRVLSEDFAVDGIGYGRENGIVISKCRLERIKVEGSIAFVECDVVVLTQTLFTGFRPPPSDQNTGFVGHGFALGNERYRCTRTGASMITDLGARSQRSRSLAPIFGSCGNAASWSDLDTGVQQ